MIKLYELSSAYLQLQDAEDLTEEEVALCLGNIKDLFNNKAISIAKLVQSLNAEAEAYDTEMKRMTERKRVAQSKVEWLKKYLLQEMQTIGIDKIKGDVLTVSIRTNPPSIIVENESTVPEQFIKIQTSVDKRAILEQFKETNIIPPGISIQTNNKSISIR